MGSRLTKPAALRHEEEHMTENLTNLLTPKQDKSSAALYPEGKAVELDLVTVSKDQARVPLPDA